MLVRKPLFFLVYPTWMSSSFDTDEANVNHHWSDRIRFDSLCLAMQSCFAIIIAVIDAINSLHVGDKQKAEKASLQEKPTPPWIRGTLRNPETLSLQGTRLPLGSRRPLSPSLALEAGQLSVSLHKKPFGRILIMTLTL